MRHFKGEIRTDIVGSGVEFEFDVEDDATIDEIEDEAREVALQYVEWWYEEVD